MLGIKLSSYNDGDYKRTENNIYLIPEGDDTLSEHLRQFYAWDLLFKLHCSPVIYAKVAVVFWERKLASVSLLPEVICRAYIVIVPPGAIIEYLFIWGTSTLHTY